MGWPTKNSICWYSSSKSDREGARQSLRGVVRLAPLSHFLVHTSFNQLTGLNVWKHSAAVFVVVAAAVFVDAGVGVFVVAIVVVVPSALLVSIRLQLQLLLLVVVLLLLLSWHRVHLCKQRKHPQPHVAHKPHKKSEAISFFRPRSCRADCCKREIGDR